MKDRGTVGTVAVSVIMPTYNQARFVGRAIESLRGQTYVNWEAVVVDDGSGDATLEAVWEAAGGDPRIRLVALPHRGPFALADSYNRALGEVSGHLVAILEGDDLWPADKLERQLLLHRDPGVVFSYGATWAIDGEERRLTMMKRPPSVGTVPAETVFREALFRTAGIQPVSALIDRGALLAAGGFRATADLGGDPLPTADFPTFLNLLRRGGRVCRTDRTLGFWRAHPGQTTDRFQSLFPEGMYRFARRMLREAGGSSAELAALARVYRPLIAGQHLADLRRALTRRDRRRALESALGLFGAGGTLGRAEAATGVIHALLGLPMEWPFAAASALGLPARRRGYDTDAETDSGSGLG